jgi:hypothetical protein
VEGFLGSTASQFINFIKFRIDQLAFIAKFTNGRVFALPDDSYSMWRTIAGVRRLGKHHSVENGPPWCSSAQTRLSHVECKLMWRCPDRSAAFRFRLTIQVHPVSPVPSPIRRFP